jgi:hypothetical protein
MRLGAARPAIASAAKNCAGKNSREDSSNRRESPGVPIAPGSNIRRRELRIAAHPRHHQMTIEACEPARAVRRPMPERLIVTIHADLVGDLDGLAAIDPEFDQPTHTEATAGSRVIAAGPVASLAAAALEVAARRDLEQPAHFGFGKVASEIEVTGVAVCASDVPRLSEVTDVAIDIGSIGARASGNHEGPHEGRGNRVFRYHALSGEHRNSLWQHRGRQASGGA